MAEIEELRTINRLFLKPEGLASLFVDSFTLNANPKIVHLSLYKGESSRQLGAETQGESKKQSAVPAYCQGSFTMVWEDFCALQELATNIRQEVETKLITKPGV